MVSQRVDLPTTLTEDDVIAKSYIRRQGLLRELIDQLWQINARSATEVRQAFASRDCRPIEGKVTPPLSFELHALSIKKQAEDLPLDKADGGVFMYANMFDQLLINKSSLLFCAPTEEVGGLRDNIMREYRKEGEVVGVKSLSEEEGEAHGLLTRLSAIPTLVGMNVCNDDKSRINAM